MIDTLLVTGANGGVAKLIRPLLADIAHEIRLSDISDVTNLAEHETFIKADLADYDQVKQMVAGVNAILHLGGISTEHSWDDILQANIIGVHNLYRAALNSGKPRIIFASSNHTVGAYSFNEVLDANALPRPDSYYGVSKVFGESVARMYFEKYGLESAIVRIGSCFEKPVDPRMLYTWFSARDFVGLTETIVNATQLNCPIVYGRSNNSRHFWDNSLTNDLGWQPQDSSDIFVSEVNTPENLKKAQKSGLMDYQGGLWLKSPLVNIED